jgi:Ca-activated chloride channel family protein
MSPRSLPRAAALFAPALLAAACATRGEKPSAAPPHYAAGDTTAAPMPAVEMSPPPPPPPVGLEAPPAPLAAVAVAPAAGQPTMGDALGSAERRAAARRAYSRAPGATGAAEARPRRGGPPPSREQYERIDDNPFLAVAHNPLSTFSLDVDRASYANVRRFLTAGQAPPPDAVRIEELVNYFPYAVPAPRGDDALAVTTEVAAAPWRPEHRLVRVAVQARRPAEDARRPSNLVFLVDVSGSMQEPDKLPLVKRALGVLVDRLRPEDRVALVVYAGQAGLVLPSTPGTERGAIREAIERLEAGGSTAGGAGLELAYRVARQHAGPGVNSRVVLATDGDFNVGPSSDAEMERLVEARRADGTYLTVLGFGTGNLQDAKMKKLAKRGNGNYAYVDDIGEARKVFGRELAGTLETVANDAKLQVEFNPAAVRAYRLVGYEGRLLRDEDFNDDAKDAGDVGAGHTVTALYEVVPAGVATGAPVRGVDPLRYGRRGGPSEAPWTTTGAPPADAGTAAPRRPGDPRAGELLYVKLRYKTPGSATSRLLSVAARDAAAARPSADLRFASAVAEWGMLLRGSPARGDASAGAVLARARGALGDDPGGHRAEFVRLVERWAALREGVAVRD